MRDLRKASARRHFPPCRPRHSTGNIRGLLCFTCNNALGNFEDDASLLRSAVTYVEKPLVDELDELARRRARALVRLGA